MCAHILLVMGRRKSLRDGPVPRGPKNPDTDMGNSSPGNAPSAEAHATPGFSLRVQLAQNASRPPRLGTATGWDVGCQGPRVKGFHLVGRKQRCPCVKAEPGLSHRQACGSGDWEWKKKTAPASPLMSAKWIWSRVLSRLKKPLQAVDGGSIRQTGHRHLQQANQL